MMAEFDYVVKFEFTPQVAATVVCSYPTNIIQSQVVTHAEQFWFTHAPQDQLDSTPRPLWKDNNGPSADVDIETLDGADDGIVFLMKASDDSVSCYCVEIATEPSGWLFSGETTVDTIKLATFAQYRHRLSWSPS